MKIVVFGATGGTGSALVARAASLGHDVIAAARSPDKVAKLDRVTAVKCDVLDAASVANAVAGADAVISVIGPADNKNPGTLISVGIANIVDACVKANVKRVVFESGLMLSDGSELSLLSRAGIAVFRKLNQKLHDDKVIAERTLTSSALDWVIVRPPTLKDGAFTGRTIAGPLIRVDAAKSMTHADVADSLVRAATSSEWVKQVVNVGFA
jgi:uncharacterized protein YbjT (DUF2867 family)